MTVWKNLEENSIWTNDPKVVLNCNDKNTNNWIYFENEWWVKMHDSHDSHDSDCQSNTSEILQNYIHNFSTDCTNSIHSSDATESECESKNIEPHVSEPYTNYVSMIPILSIVGYYYGRFIKDCSSRTHKKDLFGLHNYDFWYVSELQIKEKDPKMSYILGPFSYNYVIECIYAGYFENMHFYCSIGYDLVDESYVTTTDLVEYELNQYEKDK